ncbi:MAG: biotin--[acetyl-CoA-carboxylase] ligase [Sulfurovum sp.]|nr:biotin--[acetyl-CoA-carboxylase] ligase [Sulfurovum sp.]
MEILSFDALSSTQKYLIEEIRIGRIIKSTAVIATEQLDGIGSRDNEWDGGKGNFFASVAIRSDTLPSDLPIHSASVYFAFLMKKVLNDLSYRVWLKWPNDIYCADSKIGGVVTNKKSDFIIVGIGINLKKNQNSYSSLDTDISPLILLNIFLNELKQKQNWKQVFSQYKIEFELSKSYFTHKNGSKIDMKDAILCDDGSLSIDGGKVYGSR